MDTKITAITICRDYADFLEHTLPINILCVEKFLVVTSPEDLLTQDVCKKNGAEIVITDAFTHNNGSFNKAACINYALNYIHDGWLLHIDADIVLPDTFKDALSRIRLDKTCIYGVDRLNIGSYEIWMDKRDSESQTYPNPMFLPTFGLPTLPRVLCDGWVPLGFFQLWHTSVNRKYPCTSSSAETSDLDHARQWPRTQRILIPDFYVYHLESAGSESAANWNGRTTPKFGSS